MPNEAFDGGRSSRDAVIISVDNHHLVTQIICRRYLVSGRSDHHGQILSLAAPEKVLFPAGYCRGSSASLEIPEINIVERKSEEDP